MNLLIIFILLSIVNVIFSTIKSIVTIKSGPWVARKKRMAKLLMKNGRNGMKKPN